MTGKWSPQEKRAKLKTHKSQRRRVRSAVAAQRLALSGAVQFRRHFGPHSLRSHRGEAGAAKVAAELKPTKASGGDSHAAAARRLALSGAVQFRRHF